MKFILDTNELEFDTPSQYPGVEPIEKIQAIDRAADGDIKVENFKVSIKSRTLTFTDLPKTVYDQLRFWFDVVSDGAANTFTFIDEEGLSQTVRITSNIYSFQQTSFQLYAGTITLEITQ